MSNFEIRFELYENDTYRVIKQLQSKVLDLAIVRTPFQSDNLTCYTLVKEHLLAVGNKNIFLPILLIIQNIRFPRIEK